MGHTATAICDTCGYRAQYTVGGTRNNFRTTSHFPVLCNACEEVTSANFKQLPLKCGRCSMTDVTQFSVPGMSKGDGKYNAEMWEELKLSDGHYRCPKCRQFGLLFAKGFGVFFD